MKKDTLYVAIDVGCIECGVSTELIGASYSKEEADKMAKKRAESEKLRGQSKPEVFTITLPQKTKEEEAADKYALLNRLADEIGYRLE